MGRSWRFVVAWLTAAAAAVTVSWLGVRVGIAPAITDEAPVAIDVNRRYTEVRFGLADASPTPAPPKATPKPSRTSARPSRKPSTPARSRPAPSRSATAGPSASPSPSSSPPDRRPRYRVNAEGGDVIVAYSPTRIDVVDTEPLPGYVPSISRRGDTLVVVRLAGPSHASVVTAYWDGGPGAQIVEEYGG
ncbi:hypothetical protein AB0J80_28985 [Actinoplanes sp. NPDC049548]|uniref:hypothetical protein n=1 Tax=Actinoplanes sp. NPDC049548 TaxID=3155152 RepID=UPI003423DDFF